MAATSAVPKRIHQMTIGEWEQTFPNEDACKAYLTRHRWPEGVVCPRCGAGDPYSLKSRSFHWQCKECSTHGYRFSVLVGTVFENTNKPLREWFRVIHRMLVSKKGVSAHQIYREMGFGSYETALYMTHRIRAALIDKNFRKLMGIVEVDETYIGGEDHNRHFDKKVRGKWIHHSFAVVGAVERKGCVMARCLDRITGDALQRFVRETVSTDVSLLATDEYAGYKSLQGEYKHGSVHHAAHRYVVGAIHTNTIEGFWSILKRGIMGTFHKVSRKYLPLYVAEFPVPI
jgi:transposase-like protein